MKSKRAHILLPHDLVKEIDSIVGPRGRSAFLVETAREAVRRRKLLSHLETGASNSMKAQYTEPDGSAARWVHKIRRESERRFAKVVRQMCDARPSGQEKERPRRKTDVQGTPANLPQSEKR